MWRLTAPDVAGGPSACIFPNPAELNERDDAGGGGALVRGLWPTSPIVAPHSTYSTKVPESITLTHWG
jgi:hypothetical protein